MAVEDAPLIQQPLYLAAHVRRRHRRFAGKADHRSGRPGSIKGAPGEKVARPDRADLARDRGRTTRVMTSSSLPGYPAPR